jgi:hypothetical protein
MDFSAFEAFSSHKLLLLKELVELLDCEWVFCAHYWSLL